jgi:hypothetical protein
VKRGGGLRRLKNERDPAFAAIEIVEQRLDVRVQDVVYGSEI